MRKQKIFAVLCMQPDGGIGVDGDTIYKPGELPGDFKRFKELTTGHIVIMGRKTWESLPEKFKPLPGRINVVISGNLEFKNQVPDGVIVLDEPGKAITYAHQAYSGKDIAIIGGAQIYEKLLCMCDYVYVTEVLYKRPADTFVNLPFNLLGIKREERESESGIKYTFIDYEVIDCRV